MRGAAQGDSARQSGGSQEVYKAYVWPRTFPLWSDVLLLASDFEKNGTSQLFVGCKYLRYIEIFRFFSGRVPGFMQTTEFGAKSLKFARWKTDVECGRGNKTKSDAVAMAVWESDSIFLLTQVDNIFDVRKGVVEAPYLQIWVVRCSGIFRLRSALQVDQGSNCRFVSAHLSNLQFWGLVGTRVTRSPHGWR